MSWRDGKNHQKDVTTSYATASRCVTTVPLYGETDRITNWCDHQLCNRCITTVPFRGETDRITTCRYKILRPVSHPPNVHSFVGTARTNGAVPLALVLWLERERTEGREREKFYIYSDVTHTQAPEGNWVDMNDKIASLHSHTESVIGPKESRGTGKGYEFVNTHHEFNGYWIEMPCAQIGQGECTTH